MMIMWQLADMGSVLKIQVLEINNDVGVLLSVVFYSFHFSMSCSCM